MEPCESDGDSISNLFSDAMDACPPPDSEETLVSASTTSNPESIGNGPQEEILADRSHGSPPTPSLRRRRSSTNPTPHKMAESIDRSCNSATAPAIPPPREKQNKIPAPLNDLVDPENSDASSSTLTSDQSVTVRDQRLGSSVVLVGRRATVDRGSGQQSLLVPTASFVIKAIFFQINLLISCFKLPIWFAYSFFCLVTDPLGTVKQARDGIVEKFLWIWRILRVYERLGSQQGLGRLMLRLALGCFWSFYVGFVLFGLCVTAFLGASVLMRWVVEEPIQMTEALNFDYTKPSPDALVSIVSQGGVGCNLEWDRSDGIRKHSGEPLVPPDHRLQLTISLTLPESDYNRNLGIFQVRAEFLSANGRATSSSSKPCMLPFKSSHIRYIETFLKSVPLLAGYSSEAQVLRIRMTGFIEGAEPTACIRVILARRAESKPGSGIPEIYAASLELESELPLLKRIIWSWRWTIFIWVVMGLFIFELLFVLVCCTPVIFPRARPSSVSPSRI